MTPRTMEFSDFILQSRNEETDPFDLTESAPIMRPLHPKMIKALMNYMDNPERELPHIHLEGKYYACYENVDEAKTEHPALKVVKGLPYAVWEQLQQKKFSVLFDFSPHGAVVLSTQPLPSVGTPGVHQHTLPPFLEYALSMELWGEQGKWTRFHARLHTQFEKINLLKEPDAPGRYSLIKDASKLESRGIRGKLFEDSFMLTLPWTFPLSALEKLEAIIQEEFKCIS